MRISDEPLNAAKALESSFVPRRANIKTSDVLEWGPTPGCPGCIRANRGGGPKIKHTEECRKRFEAFMKQMGDRRMERQDERIKREAERRMEGRDEDMEEKDDREDSWEELPSDKDMQGSQESSESVGSGAETPLGRQF